MFLEQVVNGIFLGSTYALVAIAFTLIMGIFNILNITPFKASHARWGL